MVYLCYTRGSPIIMIVQRTLRAIGFLRSSLSTKFQACLLSKHPSKFGNKIWEFEKWESSFSVLDFDPLLIGDKTIGIFGCSNDSDPLLDFSKSWFKFSFKSIFWDKFVIVLPNSISGFGGLVVTFFHSASKTRLSNELVIVAIREQNCLDLYCLSLLSNALLGCSFVYGIANNFIFDSSAGIFDSSS